MPPTHTAALDLVVDALAGYRITEAVTTDTITQPARDAIAARWPASNLDVLVNCPWCAGTWVAAAVQVARTAAPNAWQPVARGLALVVLADAARPLLEVARALPAATRRGA